MRKITGTTGLYGVVADPIKHSLSPAMHNAAFEALDMDDVYLAFEVPADKLDDYMKGVRAMPVKGFNVSMPYKTTMVQYMDELTEAAKIAGAVNTVRNDNGHLTGHITDGFGFVMACEARGWDVKGMTITVMGAGGAANAIIGALALAGAARLIVVNRTDRPALHEMAAKCPCPVDIRPLTRDALTQAISESGLLVNGTSVGMDPHPEGCLIESADMLKDGLKVADIIYQPRETKLLSYARERGLDYMNGEDMILYQGACSFEFWTGGKMPLDKVRKELGR